MIGSRYQQIKEIGRGAMGVVYLGHDCLIDRKLAIKELVVSPDLSSQEKENLIERFYREARAAGGLSHPNIVTVYDVCQEDGDYYIVMEYIEGKKLSDILSRGPINLGLAREIMKRCLDAISYAHANGVIHRDLKPANIFLTPDDRVKVTDFGIASITGAEKITTEGLIMGTPGYMSPEQVRGCHVDGRTDLFALGVVFFELVTGRNPFDAETPTAILDNIVNLEPVPPGYFVNSLPASVERIIVKALQKIPASRFQTAEEFRKCIVDDIGPEVDYGRRFIAPDTTGMAIERQARSPSNGKGFCPSCGGAIRKDWLRCPWCSADIAGEPKELVSGIPSSFPTLTIVEGPCAGIVYPLDKAVVTVGRGLDNDIRVDDALISRSHAQFYRATDGNLYVEDLNSSNGTFVNKREVTAIKLKSGDKILMGETEMVFVDREK